MSKDSTLLLMRGHHVFLPVPKQLRTNPDEEDPVFDSVEFLGYIGVCRPNYDSIGRVRSVIYQVKLDSCSREQVLNKVGPLLHGRINVPYKQFNGNRMEWWNRNVVYVITMVSVIDCRMSYIEEDPEIVRHDFYDPILPEGWLR